MTAICVSCGKPAVGNCEKSELSELVRRAREYIDHNAAESGADILIAELADALRQSSERTDEGPRQNFERIIASLNYDGADTDSLTVGEIRRALP